MDIDPYVEEGDDNSDVDEENEDGDYYDFYDDMYDDDEDIDYETWHSYNCPCDVYKEVSSRYVPKTRSIENIRHKDVLFVTHQFFKLVEVIYEQERDPFSEGLRSVVLDLLKDIAKHAGKMENKMKDCLHFQLKNVLKLPDTAVKNVLVSLLDQSTCNSDWDMVNFEENIDPDFRRMLLNAYNDLAKIVQHIGRDLEDCCDEGLDVIQLTLDVGRMWVRSTDDKDEWQIYFGMKEG